MGKTNKLTNDRKNQKGENKKGRYDLARNVLNWGLAFVTILGIIAIIFSAMWADPKEVVDSVKDILTLLLPVIGAWVGTILAYYFSRENYEVASEKSTEMFREFFSTQEKLKSIEARDVMVKIEDAVKLIMDQPEERYFLKKDLIKGILEKDKNNIRNRLPVLDKQMRAKYMIHRSIIDKFLVENIGEVDDVNSLTLQNMLDHQEFRDMITRSFGTIAPNSNLLEAKDYIDRITSCLDVYVTTTGEPDAPVLGFITNAIITKESTI